MVFSSITFLSVFLPAVFLLHWILPGIKLKNALLIVASLVFYAYGEPLYVCLMVASSLMNYGLGLAVSRPALKKAGVAAAVVLNLGLLGVFKYAGFLAELVNAAGIVRLPVPQIALPIGISFFTFQALSYVIDVYRGSVQAQKSYAKVLLYISFFPQLIAGPIVKYHDIEKEIEERHATAEDAARGLRRFAAGLSKKVLISNVMALTADTLFAADAGSINILTAWIAAVSYLFQIYFDFSGYSDMALGMGEMFGFHFRENFRYPYASGSVREFWRRWHISLSGWFREYLYFPLGGNRKGRARTVLNKFLVFFCTGLWHGANVTFVVWGLYHGFFLMLEEYWPGRRAGADVAAAGAAALNRAGEGVAGAAVSGEAGVAAAGAAASNRAGEVEGAVSGYGPAARQKNRGLDIARRIAGHIYVLLVVTVGFVIFRAETLGQGLFLIRQMFTGFHFEPAAMSLAVRQLTPLYLAVLAVSAAASAPVKRYLERCRGYEPFAWLASLAGLVLCILSLSGSSYNPFIYFRF